ncbi:MAG TPA: glycosyltransferase family 39 protein [Gemmatimonadaceae bacterium]|nr:glycosyltransferase family 39 protein [Gemmatimonadaceae bacterium]
MTHAAAALPAPASRADAETRRWFRADVLTCAALSLFAAIVFANALSNGFVLDDRGILLGNPLVQQLSESWRAFAMPYWPEALGGGQYRPLGILGFALDWRLSGGDQAWFHAVNIAWHVLATVLLWRLARDLMTSSAAIVCAALFAVHPVHVEAVANVVGRLELMAAVFTLGALLAHRAGSRLAIPLFALGLLSKENAVVAIALIVANDVLLRPQTSDPRARRRLYLGYVLVVAAYLVTLAIVFSDHPFRVMTGTLADASLGDRLWTVATVIPHYVRLLIAPVSLSADYEAQVIPAAHGMTAAGAIGLALLASYVVAVVTAWRRHRRLAFALLWVGIAIAPVANVFFVSGITLAERALYLPSVGAMLTLGLTFDALLTQRKAMAVSVAAAALVAGAVRTWSRTPVWRDDRTYVITLLTDHPESYRAHWVAGRVHRAAGRPLDATREFALARRLFAGDHRVYSESADLAAAIGNPSAAAALRDSAAALVR